MLKVQVSLNQSALLVMRYRFVSFIIVTETIITSIQTIKLVFLVGRRRGNDPYIKHLLSLGLKVSTIYLVRSFDKGYPVNCITVQISRNTEFLDTAAVYAWVSLFLEKKPIRSIVNLSKVKGKMMIDF